MKTLRFVPLIAAFCLIAPATANADVRLGLGADYWADYWNDYWEGPRYGFLNVTLAVDGPIARNLHVGGRFGGLMTGSPNVLGVPIDLLLRANLGGGRVYFEGLLGPWLLLYRGDSWMRFHGAFGFGLQSGALVFGFEVGWLDPAPHAGLRLGFRI
jgi:hypothetical protein